MIEYIERNGIIFQIDREHPFRRFDPVTIAMIGTGIAAGSAVMQGQAAAKQGKMEQQIMNQNAALKEREADAERLRAYEEANQFQREGEFLLGNQQVSLAKGGVLTSTGTPASLREYTAQQLKIDKMSILRDGFLNESFRRSEASNLRYQGRAAYATGLNKRTASNYSALGSILTGYGTMNSPKDMNSYLAKKHGIA